MIVFSALSLFSLRAMDAPQKDAPKPGVYIAEIDNQTNEHVRVSAYAVESNVSGSLRRQYHVKKDADNKPIVNLAKTVCPGQKFIQFIPIKMSEQEVDYNYPTCVAHLQIEPTDRAGMEQRFWLYKINKPGLMNFAIQSWDKRFRCNYITNEESVPSCQPNNLFTLVKVLIEKNDLSGTKISSKTVPQMPEQTSEKPGRRIIIRRKK
jgi:hypothetical protein